MIKKYGDCKDNLYLQMNLSFFADGVGGEKTEAPTGKRRAKAREEGQVALSPEVATAFLYIIMFSCLRAFAPDIVSGVQELFYVSMDNIMPFANIYDIRYIARFVSYMFVRLLLIVTPLMIVAMIIGFTCSIIQVGWNPTTKPLSPKFSKMNPISGIKRIFSFRAIVNLLKSIVKLIIIAYVILGRLRDEVNSIYLILDMGYIQAMEYVGNVAIDLGITVGVWFLLIAGLDYAYQRYRHEKDLKMSKYEVKEEYKQSEGDPRVKAKIRQKMQEVSLRRMMQSVPGADVVITNPTHYAVAISYDRDSAGAPVVVAKGVDFLAKRIKDAAKENNVEIVENKQLARALYASVDIGREIPPELYQAVAEILAFVYKLKNKL